MIYKGKKIAFPAITKISFLKLIEKLKLEKAEDTNRGVLLDECDNVPELVSGINEVQFDKNNPLIQRLCSTLFPGVLRKNEIKGIIPPFEFCPFYVSDRFEKILEDSGKDFSFELNDFDEDQLYIFGCASILSFYYHYPFPMTLPILASIPVKETGLVRTYRIVMNGDLLEIAPTPSALHITHQDYLELLNDFNNIALWKKKFPPESWLFKGIGIINLFDVTQDQAINNITANLLINSQRNLQEILPDLKVFLGVDTLSIGFLSHQKNAFTHDLTGFDNLILQNQQQLSFKDSLCAPSYQQLIVNERPIVITDVNAWNATSSCSVVSTIIGELAFGSYLLVPVKNNQELLGYLELASPQPFALNGATLIKLNVLLPTFGIAIKRNRNELQNRKEAVIQQKFTAIHPAVKWRFEEEAMTYIQQAEAEQEYSFKDILFAEVYAMYGQFDIRSSSKKRNEAVQGDLVAQLRSAEAIVQQIWKKEASPIFEELLFRLQNFVQELEDSLLSGSEQEILSFLETEIHPLFDKVLRQQSTGYQTVNEYFSLLEPELHVVYNLRKKYDQSVTRINQFLSSLLDKKQKKAQEMFPHYFERYKTDGIEYNLYIGQSITNQKEFSSINLQNLQLWQLITTCEVERSFGHIKASLAMPLDIASLILVYTVPISIQFRVDEKRFDVAGAYNARYEIVKKRLDKACIKGTEERMTCPGKLAIVYAHPQDAVIYERYISFLEKKGYTVPNSLEFLEVEELPGISGLKVLRADINYKSDV